MLKRYLLLLDPQEGDNSGGVTDAPKSDSASPKGITPVQAKAPTAEALKVNFSLDSMPKDNDNSGVTVDDKSVVKPDAKPDSAKPDEKKIVADKPEPKAGDDNQTPPDDKGDKKVHSFLKPPGTKKEDVDNKGDKKPLVTAPDKVKVVRNYDGYTADEVKHLKQMSDEAYAYTTKILKEQKESVKAKEAIYFQHPNAYVLSPEFQQLENTLYYGEQEADVYAKQLAAIKKGEKIKLLKGFDPKTGKAVYGDEVEATDALEEQVRMQLIQCNNNLGAIRQQHAGYGSKYQTQVQQDLQLVQQHRQNNFPWVKDASLMDFTITVDGGEEKSVKQIRDDVISVFPSYFRNHPAVDVCGDLVVALMLAKAELDSLQASSSITKTKLKEAVNGEPSSDSARTTEKAVHGVKQFSMVGVQL